MKAQMFNKSFWIEETNPNNLKSFFDELLIESGFTVEGFLDKKFEPQGYTCLWLLSESHLAIHTFPEHSKTYIELSSCIKLPFDRFIKRL